MNLNRAGITASLALWKRRQAYRQKRLDYWRGKAKQPISGRVVVTKQEAALIHKWEDLKAEATKNIALREKQLAELKPLREKALDVARTQVGVVESGGNNKGVPFERYQKPNGATAPEPWCGDFVAWCYRKVGSKVVQRGWASTIWLLAKLTPVTNPQPGHIVVYDFGTPGAKHTGLFDEWADRSKGLFWAIEGNTGSVDASDGGGGEGVHRKLRSMSQVAGFRRINA